MQYWLSKAVFEWSPRPMGAMILGDLERVRRPHAILAHAERMLSSSESEFFIADSISALKRAINSRLRHLEEIYEFQEWCPKQAGSLERLEYVGLGRPFLIKQLFDLRNAIEHNDAPAPSVARAREFFDITWYFLRSTDAACKLIPDGVMLEPAREGSYCNPKLWLEIRVLSEQRERFEMVGGYHLISYRRSSNQDSWRWN